MKSLEKRYTGYEIDPNYYYSKTPTEMSIKEALDNFDEYSSNCKFVSLTGVITRFIGVNFYFQDANGYALYVYMGINAKSIGSMFSVGDTIDIRGRLSSFGGQKQLTDIVFARETFIKVTDESKKVEMPSPITLDASKDLVTTTLDKYIGKLVEINVKLTSATRTEANMSKDLSYTVNTSNKITDLAEKTDDYNTISIRINGTLNPGYTLDEYNNNYRGKNVKVTGILSIYFEEDKVQAENYPSYQIVLGNRNKISEGVYESEFVVVE